MLALLSGCARALERVCLQFGWQVLSGVVELVCFPLQCHETPRLRHEMRALDFKHARKAAPANVNARTCPPTCTTAAPANENALSLTQQKRKIHGFPAACVCAVATTFCYLQDTRKAAPANENAHAVKQLKRAFTR